MRGTLTYFGVFILMVALGLYAGNINSTLLGIDLTTASQEVVNLFKIGFWSIGVAMLYKSAVMAE